MKTAYEIMHGDTPCARLSTDGKCDIIHSEMMPFSLYLQDTSGNPTDIDPLVDNLTNQPVRLHELMDFNRAFSSFDTLEGANCLTLGPGHPPVSQKTAAIDAVRKVGLNQIAEIDPNWFTGRETEFAMFQKRLALLRETALM